LIVSWHVYYYALLLLYSMYRNASIKRPGRLLNSISLFEGGRLIEALQYEKSSV